jgi:hypothetical protein
MAKGYIWVRVQLAERLHDRVSREKGKASWDDTVARALTQMFAAKVGNDAPQTAKEVP